VLNSYAKGVEELIGVKKQPIAVFALFVLLTTCFATDPQRAPKANYTVYQVGGDVKAPRPISTSVPAPPRSIDKRLKVRLSFVVMPDGSVANVQLLKRSASDFDAFAVSVVSKWRFEPATKDGKPVAVRLETEMRSHR
jgi:TonB family protein